LQLLDVDSPIKILDIFEKDYLSKMSSDNGKVHVEELMMLLYFFKTLLREWHDDSAKEFIRKDYRANALVAMVMDLYEGETDFAYQVSTILALTTLNSFYDLTLTDAWKDKLIDCLKETKLKNEEDGGSFIHEVPSLIFALQGLATEHNLNDLRDLIQNFSLIYIQVAKERIDIASASHLMFAWTETDSYNDEIAD
jgi:hypothetical protein